MKTIGMYEITKIILFLVILFFINVNTCYSQNWLKKEGTITNSDLFQYDALGISSFGVKYGSTFYLPLAKFHLKNSLSVRPIFLVEAVSIGSIKHLFNNSNADTTFGIYQSGFTLQNYFEGSIACKSTLNFTGQGSHIGISGVVEFPFSYRKGPSSQVSNPFSLFEWGAIVRGKLECDTFLLHDNSGLGKVLISDQFGKGRWSDASAINDGDWLETSAIGYGVEPPPPSAQPSLYLNTKYRNVGIGTAYPISKLHVMDGNILISRSGSEAPGSLNGSMLFGEIVSEAYPLGEWGIEYYHEGLNFWKVASATNPGSNYSLFLKNDGNVGISTENPKDKFQVNDGFEKLSIGSANCPALGSGTSYIGFNSVRNRGNWILESNGTYNGGNITYGDIEGNYHMATVPSNESGSDPQNLTDTEISDHIRMTITEKGDVGIATENPMDKFQVNDGFEKLAIGSANCPALGSGTSYVGFNSARNKGNWILVSNGTYNGGNLTYGDIEGNFHIVTVPSNESGSVLQNLSDTEISDHIRMTVTKDGDVGIGTIDTKGYQLAVNGKVICVEMKVKLQTQWPDYVLNKDYKLRSLKEVGQFIQTNNHLPDLPSATEVAENGVNVGEMNAQLVKKVEELTLYLIAMQKEMDQLKANIAAR